MISEFLHRTAIWITGFGYWGIFVACFGVFPAEVAISALAAIRPNNLVEISLTAALGETFGAIPPYLLGLYFHKKDILGFIEKRGKIINVSKTAYENGYRAIKKKGGIYLFFARFIPWLRVVASIVAGYVKYNYIVFSITVFIPTFIYAYGFAYLGARAGFSWQEIKRILDTFNNAVLILIGIGLLIYGYKNREKIFRKKK